MNTILTLQDPEQARSFYERGWWSSDTLYMLLRAWADRTPDCFALRDTNGRLTYRAALGWVDAIAQDLHDSGLRAGDRVSVWLPSRLETALVFLACSRMGYACNTSLHRDYTCSDIVSLLQRAGSSAFFAQPGYGADASKNDIFSMLGGLSKLKKVYRLDPLKEQRSDREPETLFGSLSRVADSKLPFSANPNRLVYLAYTSGTTGQPKGVMHSDNTILANSRAMVKDWSFDRNTVVYSFSPLSHNIGIVGLAVGIAAGGEVVVHTPLDAPRMFDRVVETGATFLLGVPTHALDLLAEVRRRNMKTLGKVTAFEIGGSAVPPTLVSGLFEIGVMTQNAFGMTENHSFLYTRPDDTPEVIASTCGKPTDGMETKLWRESNPDEELPAGEVGELGVRGASLMLGYFGDQAATESSFNAHGWFMTGDLARLDAAGNVQIVGRKKDLIIRGGHNIYPAKIEDFTMRYKAVAKAAAFPVPDERLGEKVCLAVIPRPNETVAPMALLAHLNDHGLSKFDMPEYFISLEAFPLTASGKVLKRRLVEMVKEGALTPQPVRWQG
ncbi:class I adenylate-forming enzyme family protein [Rhodoplanes sp. Z2-YC6860]|uniref:class I adenylate-forming enzyme family protein n=1 Tax=Rhodoplanes sp. Z2-YC6860 TaxID=674703 RepID=UPI00078EBAE7|nr:class I adenylate-forming enzyme family protein [Rhodoplanes sp. Z2-YC6860]AMN41169.1 AMP-dependent synthetase and ligase [Rhodoplanes sp. Z2-YC6860]